MQPAVLRHTGAAVDDDEGVPAGRPLGDQLGSRRPDADQGAEAEDARPARPAAARCAAASSLRRCLRVVVRRSVRQADCDPTARSTPSGSGASRRYSRPVDVHLRLLGPLEVWDGQAPRKIGGTKERTLLTLLVLHAGRAVSVDAIADALWGDDPPASATKGIPVLVTRLRKALGAAPAHPDRDRPGSATATACACRQGRTDIALVEDLARAADLAVAAGELDQAVQTLARAESLVAGGEPRRRARPAVRRARRAASRRAAHPAAGGPARRRGRAGPPRRRARRARGRVRRRTRCGSGCGAADASPSHRVGRTPEALRAFQTLRTMMIDEVGLRAERGAPRPRGRDPPRRSVAAVGIAEARTLPEGRGHVPADRHRGLHEAVGAAARGPWLRRWPATTSSSPRVDRQPRWRRAQVEGRGRFDVLGLRRRRARRRRHRDAPGRARPRALAGRPPRPCPHGGAHRPGRAARRRLLRLRPSTGRHGCVRPGTAARSSCPRPRPPSSATASRSRAGLRDLGVRRLKDLLNPEHIFQVEHPELPSGSRRSPRSTPGRTTCPVQPTGVRRPRGRDRHRSDLLLRDERAARDAHRTRRHRQDPPRPPRRRPTSSTTSPTACGSCRSPRSAPPTRCPRRSPTALDVRVRDPARSPSTGSSATSTTAGCCSSSTTSSTCSMPPSWSPSSRRAVPRADDPGDVARVAPPPGRARGPRRAARRPDGGEPVRSSGPERCASTPTTGSTPTPSAELCRRPRRAAARHRAGRRPPAHVQHRRAGTASSTRCSTWRRRAARPAAPAADAPGHGAWSIELLVVRARLSCPRPLGVPGSGGTSPPPPPWPPAGDVDAAGVTLTSLADKSLVDAARSPTGTTCSRPSGLTPTSSWPSTRRPSITRREPTSSTGRRPSPSGSTRRTC